MGKSEDELRKALLGDKFKSTSSVSEESLKQKKAAAAKDREIAKQNEEAWARIENILSYQNGVTKLDKDSFFHRKKKHEKRNAKKMVEDSQDSAHIFVSVVDTQQRAVELGYLQHAGLIGGIGFGGIGLIAIPFIMLGYYLAGEKIPFTFSNGAKLTYLGAMFTLFVIGAAIPAIGVPIALSIASATFAEALYYMGKTLYDRYKFAKQLSAIESRLTAAQEEMVIIQQEANTLLSNVTSVEEYGIDTFIKKLTDLEQRFATTKEHLSLLYKEKSKVEDKINRLSTARVLDKGAAVTVGAGCLTGLVISLFIPFVGFAVLAGSALAGAGYLMGRLTHWGVSKMRASEQKAVLEYEPVLDSYESMRDGLGIKPGKQHEHDKAAPGTEENPSPPDSPSEIRKEVDIVEPEEETKPSP